MAFGDMDVPGHGFDIDISASVQFATTLFLTLSDTRCFGRAIHFQSQSRLSVPP
jgi:hypothetical protein